MPPKRKRAAAEDGTAQELQRTKILPQMSAEQLDETFRALDKDGTGEIVRHA